MRNENFFILLILLLLIYPNVSFLKAEDYSSTNFILRDPVITVEGGRSTSTSFEYFSSTGQVAGGENTSASFISRSGFLYFPTATSPTVSVTPEPGGGSSGGGGGGGGGGGVISITTGINFSGRAYPLSKVTVLKDGQVAITTVAGPDANFSVGLSNLSTGNYLFSLYGEDNQGRRSTLFNFPLYITQGAVTTVSGVFITPTIDVDKSQVARGDNIAIFGQSVPNGEITIAVNSDQEFFDKINSGNDGSYLYNFDTSPLENGQHLTKSKATISGAISSFGKSVGFVVGDKTIAKTAIKCGRADLNCDGRVNLVDFSILAYWYKKPNPPARVDLNGDGKTDLVDFSIMAYYWTG